MPRSSSSMATYATSTNGSTAGRATGFPHSSSTTPRFAGSPSLTAASLAVINTSAGPPINYRHPQFSASIQGGYIVGHRPPVDEAFWSNLVQRDRLAAEMDRLASLKKSAL